MQQRVHNKESDSSLPRIYWSQANSAAPLTNCWQYWSCVGPVEETAVDVGYNSCIQWREWLFVALDPIFWFLRTSCPTSEMFAEPKAICLGLGPHKWLIFYILGNHESLWAPVVVSVRMAPMVLNTQSPGSSTN